MSPEMPVPAGRRAPDNDLDAPDDSAVRARRPPALVIRIAVEARPRASAAVYSAGDEARLLEDILPRLDRIEAELPAILRSALAQLRERTADLTAADLRGRST
jgi:hypothetical protein